MKYFDTYAAATVGAGGSQYWFNAAEPRTGRIYYRLSQSGTYNYSLLFTGVIDSTFADGSVSHCNLLCGEWELLSATVGIVKTCSAKDATDPDVTIPLTFGGKPSLTVLPGTYFTTDPVELTAEKGEYLCLEVTCQGEGIPCHPESVLPVFVKKNGAWTYCPETPFPSLVGCDRAVSAKIGFIGDSITQGCGTAMNSYTNWAAYIADMIGDDYAWWNMGLGYGRAMDAASDGTWLYKAKQVDGISVCFGVNDILRGRTADQVKADLTTILQKLQQAGVRVLLQTVPPFDYNADTTETWRAVNRYIRETLAPQADAFFDCVPVLSDSGEKDDPGAKKYGGHPNAAGGLAWATALCPVMQEFVEKTAAK